MGLQLHRDFNDGTSAPLAISLSTRHSFSTSKAPHPSYLSSCEAARLTQWPSGDRPILGSGHAGRCRLTRPHSHPVGAAEGASLRKTSPPQAGTHRGPAWGYFLGISEGAQSRHAAILRPIRPFYPLLTLRVRSLCARRHPLYASRHSPTASARRPVSAASTPPLSPTSPTSPPPVASDFQRCAPRAIFRSSTCAHACARPLA